MPIEITKYECEFCFEEYDSYKACKSHEEYCDDNPENKEEEELITNDLLELEVE